MKSKLFIVFCLLSFPLSCSAANVFFTKDLFIGMDNIDVKVLQQTLNQSNDTLVAVTGSGSKGNEITYFGPKTKDAVKRFQEKHREKILTPNGLVVGTGYVGVSTRAVLNQILNTPLPTKTGPAKTTTPTPESKQSSTGNILKDLGISIPKYLSKIFTDQTLTDFNSKYVSTSTSVEAKQYGSIYGYLNSASTTEVLSRVGLDADYFFGDNWKKYPHIFSVEPSEVSPGEKVVISGINLNDNTLTLELDNKPTQFKKTGENAFQFVVPYDMEYGDKSISLKKDNKVFQKNPISVFIKKKESSKPDIYSIANEGGQTNVSVEDVLIVKGSGFEEKNEIVTTFGAISGVERVSEKEIKFSLSKAPYLSGIMATMKDQKKDPEDRVVFSDSVPVMIRVQNGNGKSNYFGPINIKFK